VLRLRHPPSWPATIGIGVAHGTLLGCGIPLLDSLAHLADLRDAALAVIVVAIAAAFVSLLILFPFARVFAVACVLSPVVASVVSTYLAYALGQTDADLGGFEGTMLVGLVVIAPATMLLNVVVGWATMWVIRPTWLVGERDNEHCRSCGYDLTGLKFARCPECGTPPTPNS
jgi:hypothetical protein